jgi:two-component system sensor histidine kinase YesM
VAHRRSIRTSLFIVNAAIISLTTAALVSYIAIWGASRLRADMVVRLDDSAGAAQASLDERLRKMDSVSVSVLYSKLVKDRFVSYSSKLAPSSGVPLPSGTKDDALIDVLFAIIGPTMPVRQISIYNLDGKGFGTGMDNRSRALAPSTPWFSAALLAGGSMVLSLPHKDPALNRYGSQSDSADELFISLGRLLFDSYNTPIGVVEIEQSCNELFRDIGLQGEGDPETFVYDKGGLRLYPLAPVGRGSTLAPVAAAPSLAELGISDASPDRGGLRARLKDGARLVRYARSDFSGWTVAVVANERVLLAPLRRFIAGSIVLALALLSTSLLLSFTFARRITRPISLLHDEIVSLEIESLEPEETRSGRGGLNEVEELDTAFHNMRSKLKRSVDSAIEAQRAEADARMLALQSQMDPHFLYNTIATIGALAEEGLGDRAAALCAHLSDMLRYVSSHRETDVAAAKELDFTAKYLACIGVRYGERLSYSLEYGEPFTSLSLPRLLIQPIVENSVKYATRGEPPWFIRVQAGIEGGRWSVLVEDDGPGFSAEAAERIRTIVDEGLTRRAGLDLDGMGLANIAARLRLRYGKNALFEYGNRPEGGAFVKIGGATEGFEGKQ